MSSTGFRMLFLAVAISMISAPVIAIESGLKEQFLRLDPKTRLEQLCDHETMLRITRDESPYNPDKVIAYTFDVPSMSEETVKASGAVFRSRGDWYHLSFRCKADVERVEVRSLRYEIGKKVPRQKWAKYNLYD